MLTMRSVRASMALLMDLCGMCVALHMCAVALMLTRDVPGADPAVHGAVLAALVFAGSAHSQRWALSTAGFMLTLCALSSWAAVESISSVEVDVVARAAMGASSAWYVAALLQPSLSFLAAHVVMGVATGCAMHTPFGAAAARRVTTMYHAASEPIQPISKSWWG